MRAVITVALMSAMCGSVVPVAADVVTADAVADAFITSYSSQSNTNFGDDDAMHLTALHNGVRQRLLTAFDTTDLVPAGSVVQSLSIRLVYTRVLSGYGDPLTAVVYRTDPDDVWTETGVTWDNQPGTVGLELSSVELSSSLSPLDQVTWDLDVGAWEETDWFGLMFLAEEEGDGFTDGQYEFLTREADAASVQLEVAYMEGEPVPEPGTVALVALGLGGLLLRRLRCGG